MNETQLRYKSLLLIGPPGSGKGTVGKKLAAVTEQYHLSSGDIFRGISKESPMGKLQSQYSNKGLLVPDDITVKICLKFMEGLVFTNRFFPEKGKFIIDGFPRTVAQASLFDPFLDIERILLLDLTDEEVLIERLQKRAIIEGRKDDADPLILKKRMEVYRQQTEEVLSFYPKENIRKVNADQKPIEVFRDVLTALSDYF